MTSLIAYVVSDGIKTIIPEITNPDYSGSSYSGCVIGYPASLCYQTPSADPIQPFNGLYINSKNSTTVPYSGIIIVYNIIPSSVITLYITTTGGSGGSVVAQNGVPAGASCGFLLNINITFTAAQAAISIGIQLFNNPTSAGIASSTLTIGVGDVSTTTNWSTFYESTLTDVNTILIPTSTIPDYNNILIGRDNVASGSYGTPGNTGYLGNVEEISISNGSYTLLSSFLNPLVYGGNPANSKDESLSIGNYGYSLTTPIFDACILGSGNSWNSLAGESTPQPDPNPVSGYAYGGPSGGSGQVGGNGGLIYPITTQGSIENYVDGYGCGGG